MSAEIVEAVRSRVSISEVISEVVSLKRSGRRMVGLCPFHAEKTPSFFVREEDGTFCCFGCGKRGSVFDFLMETKGFSFAEALRHLAAKVGIEIPESGWKQKGAGSLDKDKLLKSLALTARDIFCNVLRLDVEAKRARDYLAERGMEPAILEKYSVGYAPLKWQFIQPQIFKSYGEDSVKRAAVTKALLELGLIREKKREKVASSDIRYEDSASSEVLANKGDDFYDSFRGRVIFPIAKSDGSVIAFGGRVIDGNKDVAKYINSPESRIYAKRASFFGLPQAVESMRKTRHGFVVEGYFDVMSMAQVGFVETVATCGTAITPWHAKLLRRFVESITVVFDGDTAGVRAAARVFEVFLNTGVDVGVVMLDKGDDPDTLALREGKKAEIEELFKARRRSALSAYIAQLLESAISGPNTSSAAVRGKAAEQFATLVSQVENAVERETLLVEASNLFGVSRSSLGMLVAECAEKQESRLRNRRNWQAGKSENVVVEKTDSKETENLVSKELSSYCRQAVVAVLLNPALAQIVIDTRESLEGKNILSVMPQSVVDFIGDVAILYAEARISGLIGECQASGSDVENIEETLGQVLAKYSLADFGLLEEAKQKALRGGANPDKVIEELRLSVHRHELKAEVDGIRSAELVAPNLAVHAELVQKKLQKRRDLDRLRSAKKQ